MNNIVDQVKCLSISSPSKDLELLNLIEENVTEDPNETWYQKISYHGSKTEKH